MIEYKDMCLPNCALHQLMMELYEVITPVLKFPMTSKLLQHRQYLGRSISDGNVAVMVIIAPLSLACCVAVSCPNKIKPAAGLLSDLFDEWILCLP